MNRRLALGALLFALLAVSAGCAGFGNTLDQSRLAQNATYDWNTTADATVNVTGGQYQAVYNVTNASTVEVYTRDTLGGDQPVDVAAVQFRYPNGTVVDAADISVTTRNKRVVITPPADRGKLAYTAPTGEKYFELPVSVSGSYEVVLPPGMRVGNFIFGDVRPRGYAKTVENDRVHLRWHNLQDTTIVVRSYLGRDIYIFGGLLGGLLLLTIGGVVYYRLQIRKLQREREEAGLGVDLRGDDER